MKQTANAIDCVLALIRSRAAGGEYSGLSTTDYEAMLADMADRCDLFDRVAGDCRKLEDAEDEFVNACRVAWRDERAALPIDAADRYSQLGQWIKHA